MEIKILQVFYGKDGLPYKDKDRQVHFPITGTGFLGASNTTKIKFYYDELDNLDETTWVAVSKLPNGKIGSRVLESYLDEELNEHYALLELDNYYTQYKGDVFISLQGYQGGVDFDYDEENLQYEIHGTPTIAATGSIKFTINYANQFVGSGQTDNINFQRILAALGTKLGMRAYSEHVEELPSEGSPDVFYVINDDPNNPNLQNIYIWNGNTRHYVWVGDNTLYLGDYYTKSQGNAFEEEINEELSNLESQVEGLSNGGPKGIYATLAALQAADPNHSYIYVVEEDLKWYYYNTSTSSWTAGGTYLADGADNTFDDTSSNSLQNKLITNFLNKTYKNEPIKLTDGYVACSSAGNTISLDITPSVIVRCCVLSVNEGDVFTINGTGGSSAHLWCIVDSSNVVVRTAGASASANNLVLTIRSGESKIIFNDNSGKGFICRDEPFYEKTFVNLFNENEISKDNAYLTSTGSFSSSEVLCVSDFIELTGNTKLLLQNPQPGNAPSICFYDSTKTFMSGEAYDGRYLISLTVPSGAKYCRISLIKTLKNKTLLIGDKLLREKINDLDYYKADLPSKEINLATIKRMEGWIQADGYFANINTCSIGIIENENIKKIIVTANSTDPARVVLLKDTNIVEGYLNFANIFEIPAGTTKEIYVTDEIKCIAMDFKYLISGTSYNKTPAYLKLFYSKVNVEDNLLKTFKGKNIAIFGDSTSTWGGFGPIPNVPEIEIQSEDVGIELKAYLTYYDVYDVQNNDAPTGLTIGGHTFTESEIGTEVTFTPTLADVGKQIGKPYYYNNWYWGFTFEVWWEYLCNKLGANPIPVTWAGSSMSDHEEMDHLRRRCAHAFHPSQIRKAGIRTPGTMTRKAPDIIILYRGINDMSHSPYTRLTMSYYDDMDWQYPETDVIANGNYGYLQAYALTIKELRNAYPGAMIFVATFNYFKRINANHFPMNNGLNNIVQYNNMLRATADFFGCGIIEFDKDGVTHENCGYYSFDSVHPNSRGQRIMGGKAIADLVSQYNKLDT